MDSLKEKVRYETELLRLLWVTVVAGIGGTISLFFGDFSASRALLVVTGSLIVVWLAFAAAIQDRNIRHLLKQMEQLENKNEHL